MKGRTVILDQLRGREVSALFVDGRLDDVYVESDAPPPGTVYRARADRPVKGQGGMFLTTPDGSAFLRQVKGLAPGDPLLVQVTGYAEPGKALPVTQKLLFKSRYAIATPDAPGVNVSRNIRDDEERVRLLDIADALVPEGIGLILRSACFGAADADVADDIQSMVELAQQVVADGTGLAEKLLDGDAPHALAWREWAEPGTVVTNPDQEQHNTLIEALQKVAEPVQPLSGGASLCVEPTRALVAVDINTGSDMSPAAGLKANIAAARALPRILRVRGLGGQITIDVAPMPKKDRRAFEVCLRAAFRADSEETALVGWTPGGNYELQRKRGRPLLQGLLV